MLTNEDTENNISIWTIITFYETQKYTKYIHNEGITKQILTWYLVPQTHLKSKIYDRILHIIQISLKNIYLNSPVFLSL